MILLVVSSLVPTQHAAAKCGFQMEDNFAKRNVKALLQVHSQRMEDTWRMDPYHLDCKQTRGTQPRCDQVISSFDLITLNGPEMVDLATNEFEYPAYFSKVPDFDYSFVFGQGHCTKAWNPLHPEACLIRK